MRISECEVLETLVIFVPLDHDPEQPGPPFDYAPYWISAELILSQLPLSVQFLELVLDIIGDSDVPWFREVFREVQWADVSRSLTRLPKLKRLKMYSEDRWDAYDYFRGTLDSWTKKYIYKRLPDLKTKGVLDLTADR